MINSKALFQDFVSRIRTGDETDEIRSTGYLILESVFRISKNDILSARPAQLTDDEMKIFDEIIQRVNSGEPVQYIIGEADFCGRKFLVDRSVLIPRPETEELTWLAKEHALKRNGPGIRVVDIGTGSGCIPITLALELKDANVTGTDISPEALSVAGKNAIRHRAAVTFVHHDILREEIEIPNLDIVTSNPPYVTKSESARLAKNVADYEPDIALFVPDDDPLLFYKAISAKAFPSLGPGGLLIVEINEKFGREVAKLMSDAGFRSGVRKDINGKERIVTGIKPEN